MQMRRWRRLASTLAFGVLGLGLLLAPVAARADGPAPAPAQNERIVKIGPQAVVIVNEHGGVRMYDDPSQQVSTCTSTLGCLGKALGVFGVLTYLSYEDAIFGTDVGGRHVLVGAPD